MAPLVYPQYIPSISPAQQQQLPGLVKANLVKRVDSVEKADLCYWDAQDGERLDHWLEAPWGTMGHHGAPICG